MTKKGDQESNGARRRVQMDLPPKSVERLEKLKASLEAASYAEVMKDAIRLLEYFDGECSKGNKFFLRDKDGHMTEVRIFI